MSHNRLQAPSTKGLSSLTCKRVEQIDQPVTNLHSRPSKMIMVILLGLLCFVGPSNGLDRPLLGIFAVVTPSQYPCGREIVEIMAGCDSTGCGAWTAPWHCAAILQGKAQEPRAGRIVCQKTIIRGVCGSREC